MRGAAAIKDEPFGVPFRDAVEHALGRIGDWWERYAVDLERGGFFGRVRHDLSPDLDASKSLVATARTLWFFSRIAQRTGRDRDQAMAQRAHAYLLTHFADAQHGGFWWQVSAEGHAEDRRKHAYGQAFALYGLARYAMLTGEPEDRAAARAAFDLIESRFGGQPDGGYAEAYGGDWTQLRDVRLSERDLDAPRSMNTHLHVMEAYTELARLEPAEDVHTAVRDLVNLHVDKIYDPDQQHLRLFWDVNGADRSPGVSFGHDIEASWLLWEAADRTAPDGEDRDRIRGVVLALADRTLEVGVDAEGGVRNERARNGRLDATRIWWVQAEALVGFLNAYQLSGDRRFVDQVEAGWRFVTARLIDPDHGEWRWSAVGDPAPADEWIGPWKACYHHGRALIEVLERTERLAGGTHL